MSAWRGSTLNAPSATVTSRQPGGVPELFDGLGLDPSVAAERGDTAAAVAVLWLLPRRAIVTFPLATATKMP